VGARHSFNKNPPDLYGDEIIEVAVDDEPIINFSATEIVSNLEPPNKKYTELDKYQLPQVIYFPCI
jgi:hypothetical protein